MAAADVGDGRPRGELVDQAVDGGQPLGDEVGVVPGPEEPLAAVVHVGVVVVPAHPVTVGGRGEDAVGVTDGAERDLEEAGQERRAALVGEGDDVLRRQGVGAVGGLVGDERAGRLGVEPLAGVGLGGAGRRGERGRRHRAAVGERLVVAEPVAHDDEGAVERGAHLVDGAEDERHQGVGVDRRGLVVRHGGVLPGS